MGWQTQSVIQLFAGDTIINPNGMFVYSAAPAAGNLIFSVTPNATLTDNFGNKVISGTAASYGAGFATSLAAGTVSYYLGTLSTGWTLQGELEISLIDGHLILNFTKTELAGTLTVDGAATIVGTLSVNGSGSTAVPAPTGTVTAGLTDGTIHGTSGPASAGTAHTHTPGSFAVGNGQHVHDMNSHTHVL